MFKGKDLARSMENSIPTISDNGERKCHYCGRWLYKGRRVPPGMERGQRYTRDHIIPRSRGGSGLTVSCCRDCNLAKADKDYIEFVGQRGAPIAGE